MRQSIKDLTKVRRHIASVMPPFFLSSENALLGTTASLEKKDRWGKKKSVGKGERNLHKRVILSPPFLGRNVGSGLVRER